MAKIAFISELPFTGKVDRNHNHMRTEFAQFCALEADHYCFYNLSINSSYDHIILLISKTDKLREFLYEIPDLVSSLRKFGKKIWLMQESTAQIYQTKPLHLQIWHYNLAQEVDGILSENVTDFNYFKGLALGKQIETIPTLIIEDNFLHLRNNEKEEKVMIGGNCDSWYAGFDSYVTATEFNCDISAPTMRKVENESQFINLLPHVTFSEWMNILSTYKYAVHLMPNITAGTFSLNCSFFGIPCIGYVESDTQRLCQPLLSVEKYDLEKAVALAKRLKTDQDFYNQCATEALENYQKHFHESVFLQHMNNILKIS